MAAGAAIGLTAGAAIGWRNDSGLDDRLQSAALGAEPATLSEAPQTEEDWAE